MQPTPHLPPGNAASKLNTMQQDGNPAEGSTKIRAANAPATEHALSSRQGSFRQALGFMQHQSVSADPETQKQADEESTDALLYTISSELHLQNVQASSQPLQSLQATALNQAATQPAGAPVSRAGSQTVDRSASLAAQLTTGEQRTAMIRPDNNSIASLTPVSQELISLRSEGMSPSLAAASGPDQAASALTQHQPTAASATRAVWATVPMDAAPGKWGEQMLQVLQDRVYLQASQQMQEARIRLDPPDLGKLDLVVRVDGDRLNVQINANHSGVRDALVQVSDRLRAELAQQQFVHVDVNVGSGDQGRGEQTHTQQEDDHYQPVIHQANDPATPSIAGTPDEHWLSTTA